MGKHTINWNDYPPVEEYNGTGYTNENKLDIEIGDIEDRPISVNEDKEKRASGATSTD